LAPSRVNLQYDPPVDCHCDHGWICEEHPSTPYPHADCSGPGQQCNNPDCPYWQGEHPKALEPSRFDVLIASSRDSDEDH
jgi:hypothetical protein